MAVYDLEEQEQLSELKAWWARWGTLITTAAVALALIAVGWQGWQWYQTKSSAEASVLYAGVQRAAAQGDATKARELAGQIFEQYGRTAYGDLAALVSGKAQFDAGDLKNAEAQLSWAVEHGRDPALRDLARMRLAVVLIDQGRAEAALQQLAAEPRPAFKAGFADVRGDALAAQGKKTEARAAYQAAMDALDPNDPTDSALRQLIKMKHDVLGVLP
ncbi:MAG: tetratricopeptide repeat protein [Zoogloeaceae bacterium]|nr:tetratricopeptide repeat protein [Zoogloeaceae bacterium]